MTKQSNILLLSLVFQRRLLILPYLKNSYHCTCEKHRGDLLKSTVKQAVHINVHEGNHIEHFVRRWGTCHVNAYYGQIKFVRMHIFSVWAVQCHLSVLFETIISGNYFPQCYK